MQEIKGYGRLIEKNKVRRLSASILIKASYNAEEVEKEAMVNTEEVEKRKF